LKRLSVNGENQLEFRN